MVFVLFLTLQIYSVCIDIVWTLYSTLHASKSHLVFTLKGFIMTNVFFLT